VEYGALVIVNTVGNNSTNLHVVSQITWLFISATVIISDLHQFSLKTEYNLFSCLTYHNQGLMCSRSWVPGCLSLQSCADLYEINAKCDQLHSSVLTYAL